MRGEISTLKRYDSVTFYNSKTCLKWPLKIDKTKALITNDSLMKVKSIAEISILQYF